MIKNKYFKRSELSLQISRGESRNILKHAHFTAPFKITSPFYDEKGNMQIMMISVSAGIMAGDQQAVIIHVGENAQAEILSQSYEKIHKMPVGAFATRDTHIQVKSGGRLVYSPLPTLPYTDSSFTNTTTVHLEDRSASLVLSEIIACGRASRGERFAYQSYKSQTKVMENDECIYYDYAAFLPQEMDMEEFCLYEGFTHLSNLLLFNMEMTQEHYQKIVKLLAGEKKLSAGISKTGHGDYCVKALAHSAENLMELQEKIKYILHY